MEKSPTRRGRDPKKTGGRSRAENTPGEDAGFVPAIRRPRVALIIETSLASGREILQGIARYLREHRSWSVFYEPRSLTESVPLWLHNWDGDGIIARVSNTRVAEAMVATGMPVVDVLGMVPEAHLPLVHIDDRAVATLAADSLLELGVKQFGFCGIAGANWSDRRRDTFMARTGGRCQVFEMHSPDRAHWSWEREQEQLARWLVDLPKPCGLMVCSDQRGEHVIEACRRGGVGVPDEIAVIGVDNDTLLCDLCDPPLSSVDTALDRIGYTAAGLLDDLMIGRPPPEQPILFPPKGLVVRASSDAAHVPDQDIAQALRFIREKACERISVDNVADHVTLSRSTLQRRFRSITGRSVHDEILRRRVTRAQELLRWTDLPVSDIARRAGFEHPEYLAAVFRKLIGQSPRQFRAAAILHAPANIDPPSSSPDLKTQTD